MDAEEKEQASESGKPRPDFNFKAKSVLTILNIAIYKHVMPDGCAAENSRKRA